MNNNIWVKFYRNGEHEEDLSFKDAKKLIQNKKIVLLKHGLQSKDRVIVLLPNCIDTLITYLAMYELKIIAVPQLENAYSERINYIISECKAKAIVRTTGIEILNTNSGFAKQEYENICTIIYTSGTTGEPKGVCLSWNNWLENAKSLIDHHNLSKQSVIATCLPLAHCNAHGLILITSYIAQSKVILFDRYNDNILDVISKEQVQILSIVPAVLYKLFLVNSNWKPNLEFKYILTAAAPLSLKLFKNVRDSWGVYIVQGFGLSESTNFSCTLPINLSKEDYLKIMDPYPSIGVALKGVKVKVGKKDLEDEVGELQIYSKSNFFGYFKNGNFEQKEEVPSGDLGYYKIINNRKFFYLIGRIKEIINRGGEKISPVELESELGLLGLKGEFAVIKIPSEKFGEEVALAITYKPDMEIFYAIPWYRRPKTIFVVEKINVTVTGKIQRSIISNHCLNNKYISRINLQQN